MFFYRYLIIVTIYLVNNTIIAESAPNTSSVQNSKINDILFSFLDHLTIATLAIPITFCQPIMWLETLLTKDTLPKSLNHKIYLLVKNEKKFKHHLKKIYPSLFNYQINKIYETIKGRVETLEQYQVINDLKQKIIDRETKKLCRQEKESNKNQIMILGISETILLISFYILFN